MIIKHLKMTIKNNVIQLKKNIISNICPFLRCYTDNETFRLMMRSMRTGSRCRAICPTICRDRKCQMDGLVGRPI